MALTLLLLLLRHRVVLPSNILTFGIDGISIGASGFDWLRSMLKGWN